MSEAPATSWAVWAWQAYKDGRLVEKSSVRPDREHVAFALWKAEADRAAPNVGKHRTPRGFAEASDQDRTRWLMLADAAIHAMVGDSHD